MADELDFAQFREGFVAEAHELLRGANQHLLVLDRALKEGRSDPRPVRELFRALHTIKGLAAMVGVEPIVTLAHALEAVLRQADQGWGRLPVEAIDVLDAGVRAIEQRVAALEREEPVSPPSEEVLAAIAAIALVEERPSAAPGTLDLDQTTLDRLSPAERDVLVRAASEGRRVVAVDFTPSRERAAAGVDINSVRERVGAIGEILRVVPLTVPAAEDGTGGLCFRLLVITDADDAALQEAAKTPQVRSIVRTEPAPEGPPLPALEPDLEPGGPSARGVVRVEVARLDDVMETLSALVVSRFRLEREIDALRTAGVQVRNVETVVREQRKQLRDLRGHVMRLRMVPVSDVLERIPLLVRGLLRATGKRARLELDAGRAEVDKAVADRLFPAIVHLVRNAIDHAIEPPHERRRTGKPEEGHVRVTCFERTNNRLELAITDDGRGVDAAAVARSAGEPVPDDDRALLDLLTRPGLTTREETTTTSGRGLGMDIVRRVAERELGGELRMETRPGAGTTFTLTVPLSLAILDVFAFSCADQTFVVPVSMVEEIIEVDPEAITVAPGAVHGRQLIQRRGRALPLVPLGPLFALGGSDTPAKALVILQDGHPWGFGVDRLLGQHEVVVRSMEHPLVRVTGVSGATDLGDGRPTLVLDLVALGRSLVAGREGEA